MSKTRAQLQAVAFLVLAAIFTARGELVTDFVATTNAVATNLFSGRVGIGTNSPSTLLDVNGNAIIRGNLIASNGLTVSGPVSGITAAQVGAISTTDRIYRAALTNEAQFATTAQGAQASTALQPNSSGARLTGITAAQVGAVATNDARYLAALTNIPAGAVGTAQLASGAVTTGKLDLVTLDSRYVRSTNAVVRIITNSQPNVIMGTNVLCVGSLAVGSDLVVNGMISGNGAGISNVSVDASQITTGTLSTSVGGVWNAANIILSPVGDIPTTTAFVPGYRYYRLVMNAVGGNSQGMVALDELQFKVSGAWLTNHMTGNASGAIGGYVPTISASAEYSASYAAYKAFDGVIGTSSSYWNSPAGCSLTTAPFTCNPAQWIGVDFKTNVQISGIKLTGNSVAGNSNGQYNPTDFVLQGSSDNSAWTVIIGSARTGVNNLTSTSTHEWTWLNWFYLGDASKGTP